MIEISNEMISLVRKSIAQGENNAEAEVFMPIPEMGGYFVSLTMRNDNEHDLMTENSYHRIHGALEGRDDPESGN